MYFNKINPEAVEKSLWAESTRIWHVDQDEMTKKQLSNLFHFQS